MDTPLTSTAEKSEPAPATPPPAAHPHVPTPGPAPDAVLAPEPLPPATGEEKVAWLLMVATLTFVLMYHMVPALVAGLAVYSLIRHLTARLSGGRFASHGREHLVVVVLLVVVAVAVVALLSLLLVGFLKGKIGGLPLLLDKMASVLENIRDRFGDSVTVPDATELRASISGGLREHAHELREVGAEVGRLLAHALVGIVIAAMATFDARRPTGPLLVACLGRLRRLQQGFEQIVFAQVKISALNALLTGVFLLVALPLFDVHLPLRKTMVVITFLAGMIPIAGNLISNSIVVIIALGTSLPVAIAALCFLVLVHKLEYFVNARIVGGEIHAAAWEMLAAILVMEAAFGIQGVIAAPILYAYLKIELGDRGLMT